MTYPNFEKYTLYDESIVTIATNTSSPILTFNTKREMKEYRKIATVKAKLFEKGDEDGMIHKDGILGVMQDAKYGLKPDLVPYISTLKNQHHRGEFGKHYLCVGIKGEKWLVEKEIFESTYEAI
jgi:hypothetical protein